MNLFFDIAIEVRYNGISSVNQSIYEPDTLFVIIVHVIADDDGVTKDESQMETKVVLLKFMKESKELFIKKSNQSTEWMMVNTLTYWTRKC
jgi:hypothetical protein